MYLSKMFQFKWTLFVYGLLVCCSTSVISESALPKDVRFSTSGDLETSGSGDLEGSASGDLESSASGDIDSSGNGDDKDSTEDSEEKSVNPVSQDVFFNITNLSTVLTKQPDVIATSMPNGPNNTHFNDDEKKKSSGDTEISGSGDLEGSSGNDDDEDSTVKSEEKSENVVTTVTTDDFLDMTELSTVPTTQLDGITTSKSTGHPNNTRFDNDDEKSSSGDIQSSLSGIESSQSGIASSGSEDLESSASGDLESSDKSDEEESRKDFEEKAVSPVTVSPDVFFDITNLSTVPTKQLDVITTSMTNGPNNTLFDDAEEKTSLGEIESSSSDIKSSGSGDLEGSASGDLENSASGDLESSGKGDDEDTTENTEDKSENAMTVTKDDFFDLTNSSTVPTTQLDTTSKPNGPNNTRFVDDYDKSSSDDIESSSGESEIKTSDSSFVIEESSSRDNDRSSADSNIDPAFEITELSCCDRVDEFESRLNKLSHEISYGLSRSQGYPGLPGRKGDSGMPGFPGLPGQEGVEGYPGLPGIQGEPGLKGEPGLNCYNNFKESSTGEKSLYESRGEDGFQRMKQNDFQASCQGPKGEKGDEGLPGRSGFPGLPGWDGLPGLRGPSGLNGKDGTNGQPGLPGFDGYDGLDGKPGSKGEKGVTGTTGLPGGDGRPADLFTESPEYQKLLEMIEELNNRVLRLELEAIYQRINKMPSKSTDIVLGVEEVPLMQLP